MIPRSDTDFIEIDSPWLDRRPSSWHASKVKRIAKVQLGKMLQPKARDKKDLFVDYARSATLQWNGLELDDVKQMWASPREIFHYSLKCGDLLISEGGDVGRSFLLKEDLSQLIYQNSINRIRLAAPGDIRFLGYWFYAIKHNRWIDIVCNRSTIGHYTAEKVGDTEVLVPPAKTQTAIADFLDRETARIDGLIQKEQRLLAMLEEKRTALISHVVTKGLRLNAELKDSGIEWVGQIPEDWVRSRLSAVCRFEQGKAHEPYVDDEGDFICVNSRFISTEGAKVKKCLKNLTPAKVNDVLMVMSDLPNGRALAKAFLVDEDNLYAVNQRVCRLRPTRIIPLYLYYLLNRNPHFLSYDDGHNQTHLPNAAFTQMPIFLPSDQQQQEIVSYLVNEEARFGALKSKITRAIGLLREKRTALISAAVTGKIEISEGSQV